MGLNVIPHLAERFLVNKENPLMYGMIKQEPLYITDAVEGTVLAIESDKSNGEIFI